MTHNYEIFLFPVAAYLGSILMTADPLYRPLYKGPSVSAVSPIGRISV